MNEKKNFLQSSAPRPLRKHFSNVSKVICPHFNIPTMSLGQKRRLTSSTSLGLRGPPVRPRLPASRLAHHAIKSRAKLKWRKGISGHGSLKRLRRHGHLGSAVLGGNSFSSF